uniref:t-SNARE coiled-coil homology domain-containing protein n=1 Tax=Noctiluca scintillans TaxID=2966 RepID=A0A7S1EW44_NOCSC|mmetsp:Transcript_12669/g.35045  ORF Transcript_12669/g.35045 Transcript_12669/m.35045 type:complete len:171 (+) Transcript_12669:72-584(+)
MSRRPQAVEVAAGMPSASAGSESRTRAKVDPRAALFGRPQGKGAGRKDTDAKAAAYSREVLERQNDAAIDDLESRVTQLKEVTMGISQTTKESVTFLEGMGIDFDKAGLLMRSTLGNLNSMMKKGGSKHMCYLIVFIVTVFFLLYFLRSRLSFGGESKEIKLSHNDSALG